MRYRAYEIVYRVLWRLGDGLQRYAERWAYCPNCGQNRYSGTPCM